MDYTSHNEQDLKHILDTIEFASVDELIAAMIPKKFLLNRALDMPAGASEYELQRVIGAMGLENRPAVGGACFLGGGVYDHYIPAAVPHLLSRSEFYTAYTPYQAEVAQGTLQTIYEFQTMVCRLTGMEAASASHYDGATALAEGVLMAVRKTHRNKVVIPYGLNPHYAAVLRTYCEPPGIEVVITKSSDGRLDLVALAKSLEGAAALVIQQPNYFGLMEPAAEVAKLAAAAGALTVASTYPVSLGLLMPPSDWGADIATAEGQSLGISMSLGGPYVGLLATKKDLVRTMPGRIVARAKDRLGRDGFVLTLQTREQHIRREKATSNICTNQALLALAALIHLSLIGRDGLRKAASNSYRGAHYLAGKLAKLKGFKLPFEGDFSEFVLKTPIPAVKLRDRLGDQGTFIGPLLDRDYPELENCILVAVTEKNTREEIDSLVKSVASLAG